LLKKFKEFNSYFDNNFINFYKSVDIGIALDIEKGLKVVTIKGTNEYGYNEICEKLEGLVNLYLDDKLLSTDISSPTFTITDLSFENITSFIPLINRKNSAILGISSLDSFSNKMILSLTFDHRISSGKQSSRFLNDLKTNIQSHLINKTSKPLIFSANCLKCNISSLELEDSFGFIKVLTKEGKEGLCCRSCYNGW
jgi:pyruvate/2-oxoglutarate dehydrogenase complex dihydrolipoamide acyltransferase (E2) component